MLDLPAGVLAHQGGWDEVLLVAVPLLLIGLLLAWANVRAKRRGDQESADVGSGSS